MNPKVLRFWVIAMPVFSLVLATATVGYQYAHRESVKKQLAQDELEIRRLDPKSTETYSPDTHSANK